MKFTKLNTSEQIQEAIEFNFSMAKKNALNAIRKYQETNASRHYKIMARKFLMEQDRFNNKH